MGKMQNLIGQRFGKLTVVKFVEMDSRRQSIWLCKCDCGKETLVRAGNLRRLHTRSCGCIQKQHASQMNKGVHNMSGSRMYVVWESMKDRCFNLNCAAYKNYGGRGITVCDEWRNNFKSFYYWAMSHGYTDELTIDRIDVNGNYEPSNCRWITLREQAGNKRSNRILTHNGKSQCLSYWARECGLKVSTLAERLRRGWTIERALTTQKKG